MKVTARILKRKGKSDGAIQIAVYYRGQQKEFSLGRSLPITEWDRVRQEARGAKNQMVNVLIRNTKNDIYQILSNDMATAGNSAQTDPTIPRYTDPPFLLHFFSLINVCFAFFG